MERRTIIAEVCPECGSLDVAVGEPRWFAVDLERRSQLHERVDDDGWVERLEFGCRDCEHHWD